MIFFFYLCRDKQLINVNTEPNLSQEKENVLEESVMLF